jgi:ankyrin repeat protein
MNDGDIAGSYPLHSAVRSGIIEECQRLIGTGIDINMKDSKRRTALHIASWKGDAAMVKVLLRAKCNPSEKALDGFTALHFAAMSGCADSCELLVSKQRSLLKDRVVKGNKTALHLAIAKGSLDVVQKLLDLGADITAKTGSNKNVLELANTDPMYRILKEKYEDYVEQLKRRGCGAKGSATSDDSTAPGDPVETTAGGVTSSAGAGELPCAPAVDAGDSAPVPAVSGDSVVDIPAPVSVPAPTAPVNKKKRKLIVAHLEFDDEDD